MNASVIAGADPQQVQRVRGRERCIRVLERAEPPGDQQVDDHDDDRHRRERRGQRQVVGDADVGVDDVADELRVRATSCGVM